MSFNGFENWQLDIQNFLDAAQTQNCSFRNYKLCAAGKKLIFLWTWAKSILQLTFCLFDLQEYVKGRVVSRENEYKAYVL